MKFLIILSLFFTFSFSDVVKFYYENKIIKTLTVSDSSTISDLFFIKYNNKMLSCTKNSTDICYYEITK